MRAQTSIFAIYFIYLFFFFAKCRKDKEINTCVVTLKLLHKFVRKFCNEKQSCTVVINALETHRDKKNKNMASIDAFYPIEFSVLKTRNDCVWIKKHHCVSDDLTKWGGGTATTKMNDYFNIKKKIPGRWRLSCNRSICPITRLADIQNEDRCPTTLSIQIEGNCSGKESQHYSLQ